jgi:hypothetical protein
MCNIRCCIDVRHFNKLLLTFYIWLSEYTMLPSLFPNHWITVLYIYVLVGDKNNTMQPSTPILCCQLHGYPVPLSVMVNGYELTYVCDDLIPRRSSVYNSCLITLKALDCQWTTFQRGSSVTATTPVWSTPFASHRSRSKTWKIYQIFTKWSIQVDRRSIWSRRLCLLVSKWMIYKNITYFDMCMCVPVRSIFVG